MKDQLIELTEYIENFQPDAFGQEIYALGIFLVFLILRTLFTNIVLAFLRRVASKTENKIDDELVDVIGPPVRFLFVVTGLSLALNVLELPSNWIAVTAPIISSLYTYGLFWALYCCAPPIARTIFSLSSRIGRAVNQDLQNFFIKTCQFVALVIGAVAILEQWDINVAAFLGGLGLAGMAVALAAKDTVANIFGTLTIFTDNTFKKDDWIQTPDVEGIVENIGLRATKIRTFSKALVNVPNDKLANSPITNWSRRPYRRITMTIGLEYRTRAEQLEKIVARLREYIAKDDKVLNGDDVPQMVHLSEFGDSSINIDMYYFADTNDWAVWRQTVNDHIIAFKKIVEEEGSAFAFPSQSLYVEQHVKAKESFLAPDSPQ